MIKRIIIDFSYSISRRIITKKLQATQKCFLVPYICVEDLHLHHQSIFVHLKNRKNVEVLLFEIVKVCPLTIMFKNHSESIV